MQTDAPTTGEIVARLSEFVDDPAYDIGMVRGVMRDARDALNALETQGAHEGVIEAWQPIETAPKDGAVVDLWGEDLGRMTDCYWGRPSHECGEMGEYCDSDWHFDTRESWVDGTFNERLSNTFITHWTLPPQPPALSSGKAALKSPDHILDPVEGKGERDG